MADTVDALEFNQPRTTVTVNISGGDDSIIVLKDIAKKPTKTGSSSIYQTNDVAAATLEIWDTSGSKQAVLSASKLKKIFHDDSELTPELQAQVTTLTDLVANKSVSVNLSSTNPNNQITPQLTFSGKS